jgi:hypothetical protein
VRLLYTKTKHLFLLAVILASTIVSLATISQTASAATANLYLADAVKKDAIASAFRVSLALCTELGDMNSDDVNYDETSASNIASGKWFNENSEPKARTGYLVDPDDGVVQCQNLFNGHDPAGALGWGSNVELACGIGYTRANGSNCVNGNGNFTKDSTSTNEIYQKIDAKYNNASGGNGFTAIQTYVMAANTLIGTCGWKPVTNLEDATPDQKNNGDLYEVKVVTGTGTIKTVLYRKDDNGDKAFKNVDNFDYIVHNCEWMKDQMEGAADNYANWVKANPAADGDAAGPGAGTDEEEEADTTTCVITGIGWILCPVMNFMASVADTAYEGVELLLLVEPLTTNTGSPLYQAWSTMRDFANVSFVIAFLFIVFSQVSSVGITNYGIKRMLPRLVIAAILVNASYWLCAIAVDLSNIIGSSLYDILIGIAGEDITSGAQSAWQTSGGWQGIVGSVLAGAVAVAILYAAIGALLPALVTAVFAIAAVFVVLSARQALVVLWVVISPLAFVAYLLPNTEGMFKKWSSLGKTLLLLFPIVALLFGASSLASTVIMNAAQGDIIIQIMGGLVTIVPLVLTPLLMKTSSGILGKIGGYVNNPNKGPFDKARKRAEATGARIEGRRKISALGGSKFPGRGKYRREARREAVNAGIARNAQQSATSYVADRALNDPKFQNQLAGGTSVPGWVPGSTGINQRLNASEGARNLAAAGAIGAQQKQHDDETKAASAVFDQLNVDRDITLEIAQGKNVGGFDGSNAAIRAAAMARVVNKADVKGVETLLDQLDQGDMDVATRQDLAKALSESKLKPTYIGQGALEKIRQGTPIAQDTRTDGTTKLTTSEQLIKNAIRENAYSPEKIAQADNDELKRVLRVANDTSYGTDNNLIGENARDALANSRLKGQISKNKAEVEALAAFAPPTPPNPTPTPPSPPPPPTS